MKIKKSKLVALIRETITEELNKNEDMLNEVSLPKAEIFPIQGRYNVGYDDQGLGRKVKPKVFGGRAVHNSDYSGHRGRHFGIDIYAPKGELVVSPISGYVTGVKHANIGKGGRTVNISTTKKRRDGWTFYHAHLDTISNRISKGDYITAGTPIGTVGDTGNARGTHPHLHFSVYRDGSYRRGAVDPFDVIRHLLNAEQIVDKDKVGYKSALSDPSWDRENVLKLEKILDKYADLGDPDTYWSGGKERGTTDSAWIVLIDQGIKLVYPDLSPTQIDKIKSDWSTGAQEVGAEGTPLGALKFVTELDNAVKSSKRS